MTGTSAKDPMGEMADLLAEANADARAFAQGCDDLAAAVHRAIWARKVDKADLRDALNRHHARCALIARGLHYGSDENDSDRDGAA